MTTSIKIPIKHYSRDEMLTRLARRKDLKFPADRYPDSNMPGNERRNYLVIGKGLQIRGGKDPMSAIPISEGFLMSYVECKPGNGPRLHAHDTNETFVAVRGSWRVIWGLNEEEHVDLEELDVYSCAAGVPRRFINLTPGEGRTEGVLLTVQAGDAPAAEWMDADDWVKE
jgi:quercetin dioxygenase-like cupin family protein